MPNAHMASVQCYLHSNLCLVGLVDRGALGHWSLVKNETTNHKNFFRFKRKTSQFSFGPSSQLESISFLNTNELFKLVLWKSLSQSIIQKEAAGIYAS